MTELSTNSGLSSKLTFLIWNSTLEATVVKTDEIRGIKQFFTLCFLLIGKRIFSK